MLYSCLQVKNGTHRVKLSCFTYYTFRHPKINHRVIFLQSKLAIQRDLFCSFAIPHILKIYSKLIAQEFLPAGLREPCGTDNQI